VLKFQQDYFERTADLMPTSIAVDDHGEMTSYGVLESRANQLAHLLRELGAKPNERVCILTAKNIHAYAGVLSALKSGGCWVPLSLSFPKERLISLLLTLKPCVVIVDKSTFDVVRELQEECRFDFYIIQLGEVRANGSLNIFGEVEIAKQPTFRLPREGYSPEDLAYIMFTSGSTGTPKGVMVLHRNTTQFLNLCDYFFDIAEGSRFAHFSELTFDPSVFDMFCCWSRGGILVPFNHRVDRINPGLYLSEKGINVLFTVPSVIASIRDSGQLEQPKFSTLRHLLLTGEAFHANLVRDWYDACPDLTIYNMYGTTETAIVSHWYKFPPDIAHDAPVPVGVPLPGIRITLYEDEIEGDVGAGECIVYGSQLSAGYWNNSYQNSVSFIRDPKNPLLPQIVYRTGDILRKDDDNLYYFSGRTDSQVKVRGHRVELTEVENALMQHPDIWEAAVIVAGKTEGGYDKHLIAFAKTVHSQNDKNLLEFVSNLIPNYMVPSKIFLLQDDLPRNQNGKVDRAYLEKIAIDALDKEQK
jgi:D-alanine--poly(phosphoribitol) ligase subunit 1